jgi:carbohydrate diacid regulator
MVIDAAEYLLTTAVSIAPSSAEARIRSRVQTLIGAVLAFFQTPSEVFCTYLGAGKLVVLKAMDAAHDNQATGESSASWTELAPIKQAAVALLQRLRHTGNNLPFAIGLGRHHPGLEGLADSYREADQALAIGRRVRGVNQVYSLDDLGVAAFVGEIDSGTKQDLARYRIGPLAEEPELIETLQAFFAANGSPGETAARLLIHRNTLTYRLQKVRTLTGLNPRNLQDAVQLYIALLFIDHP